MAINKVEYVNNSSTAGFAIAGDEKVINNSSAQTIKKDVDEGNTEDLSSGQYKFLRAALKNNDNTTYETEPGDETLPPEETSTDGTDTPGATEETGGTGENSESNSKESENGNQNAPGGNKSASGSLFGVPLYAATGTLTFVMNTFTAPFVGAANIALAATGMIGAASFDNEFNHRLAEANAATEYMASVQEYIDIINMDIEALGIDQNKEGSTETVTLELLQQQLEEAQANGDQQRIDEITSEIEKLQTATDTTEETNESAEEATKELPNIEELTAHNNEAKDIHNYTSSVADFLQEGNKLGAMGTMNTSALAMSAVISTALSAKAWLGVNIWTIQNSVMGSAMCKIAAGMFAGAAAIMLGKTVQEFKAGNQGNELQTSLSNLTQPLEAHSQALENLNAKEEEKSEEGGENTTATDIATGDSGASDTVSVGDSSTTTTTTTTTGTSTGTSTTTTT